MEEDSRLFFHLNKPVRVGTMKDSAQDLNLDIKDPEIVRIKKADKSPKEGLSESRQNGERLLLAAGAVVGAALLALHLHLENRLAAKVADRVFRK